MRKLQALACMVALLMAAAMSLGGAVAAPINGIAHRPHAKLGTRSDILVYCRGRHCDDDGDDYSYRHRYRERTRSYARFDDCRGYSCGYGGYAPRYYRAAPFARWYSQREHYDWDSPSSTCGKYGYSIGERCADARYYPPYEAPDW
jgi:hypothetical protein